MEKLVFERSPAPTVGIEIELALVDARTMALKSAIEPILSELPPGYEGIVKPELMQCFLEIYTGICETIAQAEEDLREKIAVVEDTTDRLGLRLYWTATHPFSRWQDQEQTSNDRYSRLLSILQDMGRQLVTFGLHVHVGVDTGDKAVMISDRIMRHLPMLLALSCNSPWWNNRVSGLQSHRSKIMEGLPTAGLPPLMRNWSEYVWLINHLIETGFINSIRDIWWDVRPHHNFGTVEVRVCDMPGQLDDVLAIASLVQCLVYALSEEIDQGTYQHDSHPMLVRQNKWRASRYGLEGRLVDSYTFQARSAREAATDLVRRLEPTAKHLDCLPYLRRVQQIANGPTWADRQLQSLSKSRDPRETVREMISLSRITAERPA